jgi:hypothetical protein
MIDILKNKKSANYFKSLQYIIHGDTCIHPVINCKDCPYKISKTKCYLIQNSTSILPGNGFKIYVSLVLLSFYTEEEKLTYLLQDLN